MKRRGGANGGGGPRVIDASAGEPMAHGGRSPHSGLLAWLPRYVKQLLLMCSPQSQAFGGLVSWAIAVACPPRCGRPGPRDETRRGLGSERRGAGQERSPRRRSPVFPSLAGFVGRGRPGPGRQPAAVLPSLFP